MFFGSGGGGARNSIRSRVALMRWRSASRASASASARRRRAAGTSRVPLRPRALARLADVQLAALQLVAVQLGDRPLGLARRAHLDEAEAARPSGGAIGDHGGRLAGPGLREERLEIRTRRVEGKIAHEQLLAHVSLLASGRPLTFFSVAWARSRSPHARDGRTTHKQGRRAV